jgi:hypothetical protein
LVYCFCCVNKVLESALEIVELIKNVPSCHIEHDDDGDGNGTTFVVDLWWCAHIFMFQQEVVTLSEILPEGTRRKYIEAHRPLGPWVDNRGNEVLSIQLSGNRNLVAWDFHLCSCPSTTIESPIRKHDIEVMIASLKVLFNLSDRQVFAASLGVQLRLSVDDPLSWNYRSGLHIVGVGVDFNYWR